jgi:hypothetical protein
VPVGAATHPARQLVADDAVQLDQDRAVQVRIDAPGHGPGVDADVPPIGLAFARQVQVLGEQVTEDGAVSIRGCGYWRHGYSRPEIGEDRYPTETPALLGDT